MGFPADVIVWDFAERVEKYRLSLHKVAVTSLSFCFEEKYLATLGGQDDNSLVVWELDRGTAVCGTPAATDTAQVVSWFKKTNTMLVTAGNHHVIVWQFDLPNKKLRQTVVKTAQLKRVNRTLTLSDDDKLLWVGTETGDFLEVKLDQA